MLTTFLSFITLLPFLFLFFFLALLVHPEDPLRAEFAFQERKQD